MVAVTTWLALTGDRVQRPAAAAWYFGYLIEASTTPRCRLGYYDPATRRCLESGGDVLTPAAEDSGRAWCRSVAAAARSRRW
jgi:hypothetical protein